MSLDLIRVMPDGKLTIVPDKKGVSTYFSYFATKTYFVNAH